MKVHWLCSSCSCSMQKFSRLRKNLKHLFSGQSSSLIGNLEKRTQVKLILESSDILQKLELNEEKL